MLPYFVAFLAVAVFPTALAAIGGHLATIGIEDPQKRGWWLRVVWALASIGVGFAALQQVESYRSDSEHDYRISILQKTTDGLHDTLSTSLQRQEYMRGQLESISVMVGKVGEKSTDPVVGQLAGALAKMADTAKVPFSNASRKIQVSYKGNVLTTGASIKSESTDPKTIKISAFQLKNIGTTAESFSLRWYFSVPVSSGSSWTDTPSDETPSFPTLVWEGGVIPASPQETWNASELLVSFQGEPKYPVSSKLKVFYGGEKPEEIVLLITR